MMKPGFDYVGLGCGALVVNENHETLLLLRSAKTRGDHGLWNEPGGMVEHGELIEDAIRREVREECGVEVELKQMLWAKDRINPDGSHWFAVAYLAHIVSGEPSNAEPEKHERIAWFPIEALPGNVSWDLQNSITAYQNMMSRSHR